MRYTVTVGIAHSDGTAPAVAEPLCVHPRERRVPRDVDMPLQQRFDLQLVVRVEDVVHRVAFVFKEIFNDVPDDYYLRVVNDGPDQDRRMHSIAPLLA